MDQVLGTRPGCCMRHSHRTYIPLACWPPFPPYKTMVASSMEDPPDLSRQPVAWQGDYRTGPTTFTAFKQAMPFTTLPHNIDPNKMDNAKFIFNLDNGVGPEGQVSVFVNRRLSHITYTANLLVGGRACCCRPVHSQSQRPDSLPVSQMVSKTTWLFRRASSLQVPHRGSLRPATSRVLLPAGER